MDRGERRRRAEVKMKRNEKILRDFGYRGGTIYERHIAKVEESLGYTRKHGNITHYAQVGLRSLSDRDNSCGVALLLGGILSLFYLVNTYICPELTSFEVFKDINLFADSLIFVAIIKLFTKMVTI